MKLFPYVFFNGRCEEALLFYEAAGLGRVTSLAHYRDMPAADHAPPGEPDWVMNARLAGDDFELMASDTRDDRGVIGVALSLGLTDLGHAQTLFAALSDGGKITMPMTRQFWGADFGMFTDRFGVEWMINCETPG